MKLSIWVLRQCITQQPYFDNNDLPRQYFPVWSLSKCLIGDELITDKVLFREFTLKRMKLKRRVAASTRMARTTISLLWRPSGESSWRTTSATRFPFRATSSAATPCSARRTRWNATRSLRTPPPPLSARSTCDRRSASNRAAPSDPENRDII